MKTLVLGSGGREHVLCWKLAQDIVKSSLFVAPGNAGTETVASNIDLNPKDFEAVASFCLQEEIELLIPGSEDPIVDGITDYFESRNDLKNIYVFAPDKLGAQLEGSKDFAKDFMAKHGIPTAEHRTFDENTIEEGIEYLKIKNGPYVLKADGLAAGKGVLITEDSLEAIEILKDMLTGGKFGAAGNKVVVEEFLEGTEFSVFVMTDGKDYYLLPEAKDYKRIGEGDTGLNTGGMGAVSPLNFFKGELREKTIENVIKPTIRGLAKDGMAYKGFVFFGLINCGGQPKVIEYNVRMGDPETEVVIPRVKSSLLDLILDCKSGQIDQGKLELNPQTFTTVFSVSGGYPEAYEKGKEIKIEAVDDVLLFHAGTKLENKRLLTNGGRVIAATGHGDSIQQALETAYEGMNKVSFDGKFFRKDIGQDLLKLT